MVQSPRCAAAGIPACGSSTYRPGEIWSWAFRARPGLDGVNVPVDEVLGSA